MFAFTAEASVRSLPMENLDMKSRGRWQTWVHCTQVSEDVPNIQVVAFGRKGKSPAQKVQNLSDTPFLVGFFSISYKPYNFGKIRIVANQRDMMWTGCLFVRVSVYASLS